MLRLTLSIVAISVATCAGLHCSDRCHMPAATKNCLEAIGFHLQLTEHASGEWGIACYVDLLASPFGIPCRLSSARKAERRPGSLCCLLPDRHSICERGSG